MGTSRTAEPALAPPEQAARVVPEWDLPDRLMKAMKVAGYNRAQMVEALGIDRKTIYNYLTGAHRPNWPTVRMWAEVCNVDVDWLAGLDYRVTRRKPDADEGPGRQLRWVFDDQELLELGHEVPGPADPPDDEVSHLRLVSGW